MRSFRGFPSVPANTGITLQSKVQGIRVAKTGYRNSGIRHYSLKFAGSRTSFQFAVLNMPLMAASTLFTSIHLAYLYRQHREKPAVIPADLDSIEATRPDASADPLFAYYRALAAAGRLKRKPGRKPICIGRMGRLWLAKEEIDKEVQSIRARRRAGTECRPYSGDSPRRDGGERHCLRTLFPLHWPSLAQPDLERTHSVKVCRFFHAKPDN